MADADHEQPAAPVNPPSRPPLFRIITIVLASTLLLALLGGFVDLRQHYLRGLGRTLNDQVGYVSVARHLVDTGRIESSVIYPSTLARPSAKNYFYMPGHYLVLAASFKTLGYSVLTSYVPSLIAYLISATLVFVIGWRLYGVAAAYIAWFLFAAFPLNLVFAWSAMAEMTFVAAGMLAIWGFLLLPDRWRLYAGPILLVLPVMFRETGALLSIVMFFVLLRGIPPARAAFLRAAGMMVLSVVVVLATLSTVGRGRPSLFLNNLVSERSAVVYTSAFGVEDVDTSAGNVARLIGHKLSRNLSLFVRPSRPYLPSAGEVGSLLFILGAIPVGAFVGWRRRDTFAAGVCAATLAMLALILATYTVWGLRGTRTMLVLQPLISVVYGAALGSMVMRGVRRRAVVIAVMAVYAAVGVRYLYTIYAPQAYLNAITEADRVIIEEIGHNDREVLVAPDWISDEYVLSHHPVRWSFMPADLRTFQLLLEKYDVGTVIYPVQSEQSRLRQGVLPVSDLEAAGWGPVAVVQMPVTRVVVFRPRTAAAR